MNIKTEDKDVLSILVVELVNSGRGFSLDDDQGTVTVFLDNYSLELNKSGKWVLQ